ncbi:MAG: leucyl/phenylalanyl-tRNA--protein transferase [Alphaproteobacteria bacterium]|nr:MAG: leucyl/phenylalanyl-tRNA--protein transferase [Alphaproteobacteria bacterium]
MSVPIDALLNAYANGIFPMADARDAGETYWVEPEQRGIIPLDTFNIPRSLQKFIKSCDYSVTINADFAGVIAACASSPRGDEKGTWINHDIETWFLALHKAGHAHSIEVWSAEKILIGGLYGLAQGACFCGESMFSRETNASKIALVELVKHLKDKKFTLLDTQFINDHLKQFGCVEIPQEEYLKKLEKALSINSLF